MRSWMMGLVPGVVSVGYWPALPTWPVWLLCAAVLPGLVFRRSAVAGFLGGGAAGCVLAWVYGIFLLYGRIAGDCVSIPLTVSGTVTSLPGTSVLRGAVPRQRFEFAVEELRPVRCAGPKRIQLSYYGDHRIRPGDRWQFEVRLRKPWGLANPGVYNQQEWFARNRIDAVGSVRESAQAPRLVARATGLSALPDRLRQDISTRIGELGLRPDVAAVLQAVSVADGSGIGSALWFLFQQYGINHLLVISGLHVGMVAAVGYLCGAGLQLLLAPIHLRTGWLPPVLALLLAFLYSALAGFSLPVQRAVCMLACFVVARLAGRKTHATDCLLLAAVVVLLLNPLAALGSGFWLSFGAVGALLWFSRWQRGFGAVRRLLLTQAAMSLAMLAPGALFFGGGSLVAVPANLLMIPLVGWVVVPLTLLASVCYLAGWELATPLWWLAAWPLELLLSLASAVAAGGGNWLYLPLSGDSTQALLTVLAVALWALPGRSVLKVLGLIMALPLLLWARPSATAPSLETEVTVLDVGQGTAILVRSGDRALLYDTGGGDPNGVNMGSMVVLPYLRQHGIRALDTLVISHPDLDHSAGARAVMNALPISRYRYGGMPVGASDELPAGRPCVAGEAWRWPGGQVFQFLSPARERPLRRNDASCVLQILVGGYRLLLPGDIESGREKMLVRYWADSLESDWLAAGHHGSNTSSATPFLKHVLPHLVVISNGYANRFGHPHPDVLERLRQQGAVVYSTANSGALEFSVAPGQTPQITARREAVRRYWM